MSKETVLSALEESEEKVYRFFAAWKQGVERLGRGLFGPKTLRTARAKNDLRPQRQPVDAAFDHLSGGEKQLLSAMVSFFDPDWGEELAARTADEKCLCGLTFNLDHQEREILCDLLRNYTGWEGN